MSIVYGSDTDPYIAVITLDQEIVDLCKTNANIIASKNHKRLEENQGNTSFEKTRTNFENGLFAEQGLHDVLVDLDIDVTPTRLEPYAELSWDADLRIENNIPMHVKSCVHNPTMPFIDPSWVFQSSGKYAESRDAEIYNSRSGYVGFCQTHLFQQRVVIRSIVPLAFLHDNNLFDDLRNGNKYKQAVYFTRLQAAMNL